MNEILNYLADNIEWVLPLILFLVEIIVLQIPTKDPAGLTERLGRIIRLFLETRVQNRSKNFQDKVVKPHNTEKLKK
jgi:hypothetical protein